MKAHALQVRALQVGTCKVAPLQADAGEVGTGKVSASQNGAGEARATKISTRKIGAREITPLKARTAEHAAATVGGRLGEECGGVLRGGAVGGGGGYEPRQADAQDGLKQAHDLLRPDDHEDRLSRVRGPQQRRKADIAGAEAAPDMDIKRWARS